MKGTRIKLRSHMSFGRTIHFHNPLLLAHPRRRFIELGFEHLGTAVGTLDRAVKPLRACNRQREVALTLICRCLSRCNPFHLNLRGTFNVSVINSPLIVVMYERVSGLVGSMMYLSSSSSQALYLLPSHLAHFRAQCPCGYDFSIQGLSRTQLCW